MKRSGVKESLGALGGAFSSALAIQAAIAISGVLVARTLGVEDRGFLALLVLIPTLTYQIGGLGVPVATAYFIASNPSSTRAVVNRIRAVALTQILALAAIHAAVIAAVLRDEPHHVARAAIISLAFVPLALAQHYGLTIVQGRRRYRAFNVLRTLPPALYAAGVVAATSVGINDLTAFASLWIASFAVGTAFTLGTARGSLAGGVTADAPPLADIVKFGMRGLVGSSSALETFRVDQLLVAVLLSPAALGLYVVAIAFTNLPMFVAQSIGMVAFPEVAAASDARKPRAILRYACASLGICGAIVVALEASVGRLLPWLFGSAFSSATAVARILLLGALALGVRRVLADGARGAGRPGLSAIAEVTGWICLVPLAAILAPTAGVEGVALAFTASTVFSLAVLAVLIVAPNLGKALRPRVVASGIVTGSLFVAGGAAVVVVTAHPTAALALSAGLFAVVAVAGVVAVARATGDALSPFSFVTVYYVLGFAVGGAYYWRHRSGFFLHRFTDADLIWAVGLGFVGWCMFGLGYVITLRSRIAKRVPAVSFGSQSLGTLVPLAIVGWVCRAVELSTGRYFHSLPAGSSQPMSTGSGWLVAAGSALPLFVTAYLGFIAWHEGGSRLARLLFVIGVGVELAWSLPSGDRGSVVSIGLVILLSAYYARGRMPWRGVVLGVVLAAFVVLPFGLAYRGDNAHYQAAPSRELKRAARELLSQSPQTAIADGVDASLSRLADAASVAVIVNRGRQTIDRSPGSTLSWAATAFVPRALAPTKADPGRFGNEFGRKYGILSPADRVTSVSIGEVGEFYLSFGVWGVLAALPIVGGLYCVLGVALRRRRHDANVAALYALIAWPLIQSQGTIFALGFLGVVKLSLVVCLLLWLVRSPGRGLAKALPRGQDEVPAWTT